MPQKKSIIFIYGPTGVGKSDYAVSLAKDLPIEIVNCDVGQFYTPLSIGTAKPDWKNEPVPHHLFDIIKEPVDYTVVEYKKALLSTCADIWKRGAIPVVVGGSGFYLKSLFFTPHEEEETPLLSILSSTSSEPSEPVEHLWQRLESINPERARAIHPHDRYRIERALTLTAHNKKFACLQPRYQDLEVPYLLLCLTRNRENLYHRINERTGKMLQEGWIAEVKGLNEDWRAFLNKKKLIGYDTIQTALQHEIQDWDKVAELIAQKTRHYAKRQMTFWRMLKKALTPYCTAPSAIQEVCINDANAVRKVVMKFLESVEEKDCA